MGAVDMMRLTKLVLVLACCLTIPPCLAAGDSCLEHLGGGMSDVYCYIEQAKMADDQSIGIYKSLKGSIPVKSVYRKRIERFLSVKDPGGYCEIVRGLASSWGRDINQEMSIKVGDVEYYECIYETSVQKLNKLKDMRKAD